LSNHSHIPVSQRVFRAVSAGVLLAGIFAAFGWFTVLMDPALLRMGVWWSGIAWVLPAAVAWALIVFGLLRAQRAGLYYIGSALMFMFAVMPLLDAALRVFITAAGPIVWLFAVSFLVALGLIIWLRIRTIVRLLASLERRIISAHRLDPDLNTWNMTAPPLLDIDAGYQPAKKTSFATLGLSVAAGALVIFFSKQFGIDKSPYLFGALDLILTSIILVFAACPLAALSVQLINCDRKWNKRIQLSAEPDLSAQRR